MIGIRADANEVIASGHIMRCIAIALRLNRMGVETKFYISDEYSVPLLESRGLKYHILHNDWCNKSGETELLKRVLLTDKVEVLLVDSYEASEEYFEKLHQCVKLVYMDDLCRFPYDVDMIVNYAVCDCKMRYNAFEWKKEPLMLTGLAYTPLREEFSDIGVKSLDNVSDILLTTGGSDPKAMTCKIAEALSLKLSDSIKLHVVEGPFFDENTRNELHFIENKHNNIIVHKNVSRMDELLEKCQLAMSAGGTTLLEICAGRVPCVCFAISDNQKALVGFLSEQKAVKAFDAEDFDNIVMAVEELCCNYSERRLISERAGNLVDGNGARRIAEALMKMQ